MGAGGEPVGDTGPSDPFATIVAEGYRVFRYPNPTNPDLGVCDCCLSPRQRRDIMELPARDLPLESLRGWYGASLQPPHIPKSLCGFLLPRIFELLAEGRELTQVGNEVALARFPVGDESHWSADEWQVIEGFRSAYLDWHRKPRSLPDGSDCALDDVLCLFGLAAWPIDSLIGHVDAWPDDVIARRLWADWCKDTYSPAIWTDAFWTGDSPILKWYASNVLYERMVAFGLGQASDRATRDMALDVADVIRPNNQSGVT